MLVALRDVPRDLQAVLTLSLTVSPPPQKVINCHDPLHHSKVTRPACTSLKLIDYKFTSPPAGENAQNGGRGSMLILNLNMVLVL